MAMSGVLQRWARWRVKIAYALFFAVLLWPILHMFLVQHYGFSSWRFFGWGMYATPNPESEVRLHVIIASTEGLELNKIHQSLTTLVSDSDEESNCVNLFLQRSVFDLERISFSGFCKSKDRAHELDYFLHFHDIKQLRTFINNALKTAGQSSDQALAFVTHQRFSLWQQKAYFESDVYRIRGNAITYLGKVNNEAS